MDSKRKARVSYKEKAYYSVATQILESEKAVHKAYAAIFGEDLRPHWRSLHGAD